MQDMLESDSSLNLHQQSSPKIRLCGFLVSTRAIVDLYSVRGCLVMVRDSRLLINGPDILVRVEWLRQCCTLEAYDFP